MTKVWLPLILISLLLAGACSWDSLEARGDDVAGVRQDPAADALDSPSGLGEGEEQQRPADAPAARQKQPPAQSLAQKGVAMPPGSAIGLEAGGIGESDGPPWEWFALGGAAAFASILPASLWRGWARVRQGRYAAWEQRALEAYALTAAVHQSLVVESARNPAGHGLPEESAQPWRDAQRYINDVAVDLRALEAKSPDKASASAVRELLAALISLQAAIRADLGGWAQGEPAPDAQPGHNATLVRRRLLDLGDSLRSFRPAAAPIETNQLLEEEAGGLTA